MNSIMTCFGMHLSDDDKDTLQWLQEERPFATTLWHVKYEPYTADSLFTLHMAALTYYETMHDKPVSVMHQLTYKRETTRDILDQTKFFLELPVGFTKAEQASALLQEWYSAVLRKNIYVDATYATEFWMQLHRLECPIRGHGEFAFTTSQLNRILLITRSFMCATGDNADDRVLYAIVAKYMYAVHSQLLIPKIDCYREGPCRMTSLLNAYIREAWKTMRYIHTQDFDDIWEEIKRDRWFMEWDATGLVKCLIDRNATCGKLCALWTKATHRYSFQKN